MRNFEPKDFEEVLDTIESEISELVECDTIRSIGGNFDTRGMSYKSKDDPKDTGTIFVGEDLGNIAVDISLLDGSVRSFTLEDSHDNAGIESITHWFQDSYN